MCDCTNKCNCNDDGKVNVIIGQKGDKGNNGATPTIVQGTSTTGAPGSQVQVVLESLGDNTYQFDFTIPAGANGSNGTNGLNGWSPILAIVTDGQRRVLQIVSWTGGTGTPPSSTNQFLGSVGIVSTAAAAVDIRGAAGAAATGGVPIGCTIEYGGITDLAPDPDTGAIYFIEDGRAISRTTYATLFSRIGTRFGIGNGTTTFNIPNSYGRVTVGFDTSSDFNAVGKIGGSKNVSILASNLPVTPPWALRDFLHDHNESASTTAGGGGIGLDSVSNRSGQANIYLKTSQSNSGVTLDNNAGGGQQIAILNPYIVKYKLIRVL